MENLEKKYAGILNKDLSKSKKMIELYGEGLEIKEIALLMGTRYNFVYNVISNFCRMNDLELRTVAKENKKADVIALVEAGKSNVEISKELKVCYNRVFNIRKEMERAK